MTPPQTLFVRLDSNAWLEIFLFLDLRDVVKTWVGFCLSKHGINVQHPIWLQLLSLRLTLDTNAFLLRTNYPTSATDKQGLVFFARLHKKKRCSRSGCFMEFIECENTASSCRFHPGKKTAAGVLSCCRAKNFKEIGCAARFHTGGIPCLSPFLLIPIVMRSPPRIIRTHAVIILNPNIPDFFEFVNQERPEEEKTTVTTTPTTVVTNVVTTPMNIDNGNISSVNRSTKLPSIAPVSTLTQIKQPKLSSAVATLPPIL